MKTVYSFDYAITKEYVPTAIGLGTFDGVHIGHQRIIRSVIEHAKQINGKSAIMTFNPHPLTVVNPKQAPPLITTPEQKEQLIADAGIDLLVVVPFNREFAQLSAESFVTQLTDRFAPGYVIVGPNFFYGARGTGNPDTLKSFGERAGFNTDIMAPVFCDAKMVSSTAIRKCIVQGELEAAEQLLGRKLSYMGQVVTGDRRGRTLGFPTANLNLPPELLLPPDGVYFVRVLLANKVFRGLANIGSNPTFKCDARRVEVHILDFDQYIYGETIEVQLLEKIRGEMTFDSAEALKSQIRLDISVAKSVKTFCEKFA